MTGPEPLPEGAYEAIFAEHERDHIQFPADSRERCVGCRLLSALTAAREEHSIISETLADTREELRVHIDRLNEANEEIARLKIELTHFVGWKERADQAEQRVRELEADLKHRCERHPNSIDVVLCSACDDERHTDAECQRDHIGLEGTACAACHDPIHAFQIPNLQRDLSDTTAECEFRAETIARLEQRLAESEERARDLVLHIEELEDIGATRVQTLADKLAESQDALRDVKPLITRLIGCCRCEEEISSHQLEACAVAEKHRVVLDALTPKPLSTQLHEAYKAECAAGTCECPTHETPKPAAGGATRGTLPKRVVEVIEDDESPDCGCELCLALAAFRRLVPKEADDDL